MIYFNIDYFCISDVPCITISINSTAHCTPETTIMSIVTSIPPPEKAQWQKSSDGNDFYDIDITQQKYAGSNHNPESLRLVIPKTALDDIGYYRLQISNRLGANVSKGEYLKFTGSMFFSKFTLADQKLIKTCLALVVIFSITYSWKKDFHLLLVLK